jgi:acetoin utilization protein AcuC
MTCTLHVAWDERLTEYDFGPRHPMAPVRVKLTMELALALGVLHGSGVTVASPPAATDEELGLVHDPGYIEMVRAAGHLAARAARRPALATGGAAAAGDAAEFARLRRAAALFGLGTDDDPIFPDMHEAAARAAGATLAAARAVWSGDAEHGASISGGLHHAMRAAASGFCVYNDPAVAIAWLLGQGAKRIAYVDIDVHHGDGVQAAFWDDPRVLTISLHEDPAVLFPGTGRPRESGGAGAPGSAVNIPVPVGTGSGGWLRALHAIAPPLLRQFRPEILVSQHGCDTHWSDPLADLDVTIDAQRLAHAALHALAHETAGGRWLLTGGGGYQLVQVVPRSWTHLLAEAAGRPVDPAALTPGTWREYVRWATGEQPPELMTEGDAARFVPFDGGYDPASPLDQAILATRQAVFPLHGLIPHP